MENALYIFKDLVAGGVFKYWFNGNMRHWRHHRPYCLSAIVGIAIVRFYAPRYIKFITVTIGILAASLLHAYFNLSIMVSDG